MAKSSFTKVITLMLLKKSLKNMGKLYTCNVNVKKGLGDVRQTNDDRYYHILNLVFYR